MLDPPRARGSPVGSSPASVRKPTGCPGVTSEIPIASPSPTRALLNIPSPVPHAATISVGSSLPGTTPQSYLSRKPLPLCLPANIPTPSAIEFLDDAFRINNFVVGKEGFRGRSVYLSSERLGTSLSHRTPTRRLVDTGVFDSAAGAPSQHSSGARNPSLSDAPNDSPNSERLPRGLRALMSSADIATESDCDDYVPPVGPTNGPHTPSSHFPSQTQDRVSAALGLYGAPLHEFVGVCDSAVGDGACASAGCGGADALCSLPPSHAPTYPLSNAVVAPAVDDPCIRPASMQSGALPAGTPPSHLPLRHASSQETATRPVSRAVSVERCPVVVDVCTSNPEVPPVTDAVECSGNTTLNHSCTDISSRGGGGTAPRVADSHPVSAGTASHMSLSTYSTPPVVGKVGGEYCSSALRDAPSSTLRSSTHSVEGVLESGAGLRGDAESSSLTPPPPAMACAFSSSTSAASGSVGGGRGELRGSVGVHTADGVGQSEEVSGSARSGEEAKSLSAGLGGSGGQSGSGGRALAGESQGGSLRRIRRRLRQSVRALLGGGKSPASSTRPAVGSGGSVRVSASSRSTVVTGSTPPAAPRSGRESCPSEVGSGDPLAALTMVSGSDGVPAVGDAHSGPEQSLRQVDSPPDARRLRSSGSHAVSAQDGEERVGSLPSALSVAGLRDGTDDLSSRPATRGRDEDVGEDGEEGGVLRTAPIPPAGDVARGACVGKESSEALHRVPSSPEVSPDSYGSTPSGRTQSRTDVLSRDTGGRTGSSSRQTSLTPPMAGMSGGLAVSASPGSAPTFFGCWQRSEIEPRGDDSVSASSRGVSLTAEKTAVMAGKALGGGGVAGGGSTTRPVVECADVELVGSPIPIPCLRGPSVGRTESPPMGGEEGKSRLGGTTTSSIALSRVASHSSRAQLQPPHARIASATASSASLAPLGSPGGDISSFLALPLLKEPPLNVNGLPYTHTPSHASALRHSPQASMAMMGASGVVLPGGVPSRDVRRPPMPRDARKRDAKEVGCVYPFVAVYAHVAASSTAAALAPPADSSWCSGGANASSIPISGLRGGGQGSEGGGSRSGGGSQGVSPSVGAEDVDVAVEGIDAPPAESMLRRESGSGSGSGVRLSGVGGTSAPLGSGGEDEGCERPTSSGTTVPTSLGAGPLMSRRTLPGAPGVSITDNAMSSGGGGRMVTTSGDLNGGSKDDSVGVKPLSPSASMLDRDGASVATASAAMVCPLPPWSSGRSALESGQGSGALTVAASAAGSGVLPSGCGVYSAIAMKDGSLWGIPPAHVGFAPLIPGHTLLRPVSRHALTLLATSLTLGDTCSSTHPTTTDRPVRFDSLRVGKRLGRGQSALVRRVVDDTTGKMYAIKVLPLKDSAERTSAAVSAHRERSLEQELVLLEARHASPCVVQSYNAYFRAESCVILLEMMAHGTLADVAFLFASFDLDARPLRFSDSSAGPTPAPITSASPVGETQQGQTAASVWPSPQGIPHRCRRALTSATSAASVTPLAWGPGGVASLAHSPGGSAAPHGSADSAAVCPVAPCESATGGSGLYGRGGLGQSSSGGLGAIGSLGSVPPGGSPSQPGGAVLGPPLQPLGGLAQSPGLLGTTPFNLTPKSLLSGPHGCDSGSASGGAVPHDPVAASFARRVVTGRSLTGARPPIPERVLAVFTEHVLHGLLYMHNELRTAHRDIKPQNILISDVGVAKVSDFGVSARLDSSGVCGVKSDATGGVGAGDLFVGAGTPKFMSPERHKRPTHTAACDVWALGLSVAEAALGAFPHDLSQAQGYFDVLEAVCRPIQWPAYPPTSVLLRSFVKDCLAHNPAVRPTPTDLLSHPWLRMCRSLPVLPIGACLAALRLRASSAEAMRQAGFSAAVIATAAAAPPIVFERSFYQLPEFLLADGPSPTAVPADSEDSSDECGHNESSDGVGRQERDALMEGVAMGGSARGPDMLTAPSFMTGTGRGVGPQPTSPGARSSRAMTHSGGKV